MKTLLMVVGQKRKKLCDWAYDCYGLITNNYSTANFSDIFKISRRLETRATALTHVSTSG